MAKELEHGKEGVEKQDAKQGVAERSLRIQNRKMKRALVKPSGEGPGRAGPWN